MESRRRVISMIERRNEGMKEGGKDGKGSSKDKKGRKEIENNRGIREGRYGKKAKDFERVDGRTGGGTVDVDRERF